MAFFELNVLSVGENGDTERIEIGSNYINMMDNSSNSLFLLNSSNNITSINTSLQFNVLPSVNVSNISSYLATTNYVDYNISYMNASVTSLINDTNASINIINTSLLNINDSITNLSNNASVYESLNEYITTISTNAIDSVEMLESFFVIPLANIKLNEYISSMSIDAVEAVELLKTFFVAPVTDIIDNINTLNSSVNNLSNYITNLSSDPNTQLNLLNNSINNLSNYVSNLSTVANSQFNALNSSVIENISSIETLNASLNNAIDTVNSTTLIIGGTNGISSQSYASSLTSGTLSIGNSITTGNINIGSANASTQVNVGGVLIGANAINAGSDSKFQIASTNISGSISIGDTQTSGVLNIGTNASRNSSIVMGSTTNTGAISLNTSGSISIGTNIGMGGSVTICSNTPAVPATSINGIKFEYLSNTYRIEPTTITSACNIYNNTTGGIFMGNSQFSGQITIGNVATRTGTISIGAGSANQPTPSITRISGLDVQGYKLNICANTSTTPNPVPLVIGDSGQTSAVNIGKSGANTGIQGTASISGVLTVGTINSNTSTSSLDIGTNNINGNIRIGTNVSRSSTINIGSLACPIRLSNLLVGNNEGGTTLTPFLTGTIGIGNDTFTTRVNIGTLSNTTAIAGAATVGSTLNVSGILNASGGITIGTGKNITLKSDGIAPTEQTQLGGTTIGTLSTVNPPVSETTLATLTLTTAGVYIFMFNLQIATSSKGSANSVRLNGSGIDATRFGASSSSTGNVNFNGSQVVTATATTYTLTFSNTGSIFSSAVEGFFTATRIG